MIKVIDSSRWQEEKKNKFLRHTIIRNDFYDIHHCDGDKNSIDISSTRNMAPRTRKDTRFTRVRVLMKIGTHNPDWAKT
jgi:hypothetical protein